MKVSTKLLAATCLATLASGSAWAQDITMRLGTHIGPAAPGVVEGYNVFAEHVKELTNGTVQVDVYPGEQAGKALQMYDLVKAGAVDLGGTATGYVSSDKLPLVGVLELPGLAKNVCSVTDVITKLGTEGGVIYENEIKPAGIRILAFMPYPPYGPAVSRTEISEVSDLKGLKMRNAGGLMERTVDALGGVPVKMPSPEVYQGLQRGTLDTVLFAFLSVKSYDLDSVADYGTTGYSFGTPGDILMISEDTFQSLSEDQQAAFIEAGNRTAQHWCEYVDRIESEDIEEMRAGGLNIHTWTEEQVAELNEKTRAVGETWAESLEAMGKPATEVIEAFTAEMN